MTLIGLDLLGASARGPLQRFAARRWSRALPLPINTPTTVVVPPPPAAPVAPIDAPSAPSVSAPQTPQYSNYDYGANDDAGALEETATDDAEVDAVEMLGASADSAILAAQKALIAQGFPCGKSGADGLWGPGTEKAITAFWKSKGLSHAAIVDADLQRALEFDAPATPASAPSDSPRVATPSSVTPDPEGGDAAEERKKKLYILGGGLVAIVIGSLIYALAGSSATRAA